MICRKNLALKQVKEICREFALPAGMLKGALTESRKRDEY
jgi:hypothetical protein